MFEQSLDTKIAIIAEGGETPENGLGFMFGLVRNDASPTSIEMLRNLCRHAITYNVCVTQYGSGLYVPSVGMLTKEKIEDVRTASELNFLHKAFDALFMDISKINWATHQITPIPEGADNVVVRYMTVTTVTVM